jgi:hypothetical protein
VVYLTGYFSNVKPQLVEMNVAHRLGMSGRVDFRDSTERDLGVILEVFSGMPKKQTEEP